MEKKTYLTDVALISVTNTEFNAVMHFHNWVSKTVEGDDQVYQFAQFDRGDRSYTLIHARQPEMGMTSAAATATKMIYEFRPRYLVMVGIAAGVAQEADNPSRRTAAAAEYQGKHLISSHGPRRPPCA